jgi:hypothetical protein
MPPKRAQCEWHGDVTAKLADPILIDVRHRGDGSDIDPCGFRVVEQHIPQVRISQAEPSLGEGHP